MGRHHIIIIQPLLFLLGVCIILVGYYPSASVCARKYGEHVYSILTRLVCVKQTAVSSTFTIRTPYTRSYAATPPSIVLHRILSTRTAYTCMRIYDGLRPVHVLHGVVCSVYVSYNVIHHAHMSILIQLPASSSSSMGVAGVAQKREKSVKKNESFYTFLFSFSF